jgi:hypothetical protein
MSAHAAPRARTQESAQLGWGVVARRLRPDSVAFGAVALAPGRGEVKVAEVNLIVTYGGDALSALEPMHAASVAFSYALALAGAIWVMDSESAELLREYVTATDAIRTFPEISVFSEIPGTSIARKGEMASLEFRELALALAKEAKRRLQ